MRTLSPCLPWWRLDIPATGDQAGALRMRPTLESIYEEHFEYVWRTLLRLGMAQDSVADATQNVFLTAHRRLSSFDAERPMRPWLFGIARNTAREHHRRVAGRGELAETDVPTEDGTQARLEAAQIVHRALAKLGESHREVFVLHALDGVPMKEVAETLEMPLNTAYSNFRRAKADFRAAAERLGGAQ